jgi:hypothetical protein
MVVRRAGTASTRPRSGIDRFGDPMAGCLRIRPAREAPNTQDAPGLDVNQPLASGLIRTYRA